MLQKSQNVRKAIRVILEDSEAQNQTYHAAVQ